jgi:hypothetical protein
MGKFDPLLQNLIPIDRHKHLRYRRVKVVVILAISGRLEASCWVLRNDLARLRGFEGFVSRKSLKIRTGVQKVFTTKRWVASPEKLRSQVSGGSDSWRRLIG